MRHADVAPVLAAESLLAHGLDDDSVTVHLRRLWQLDEVAARAAVSAARILAGESPQRTALARTRPAAG